MNLLHLRIIIFIQFIKFVQIRHAKTWITNVAVCSPQHLL